MDQIATFFFLLFLMTSPSGILAAKKHLGAIDSEKRRHILQTVLPFDEPLFIGSCSLIRQKLGDQDVEQIGVVGFVSIPNYYSELTKKEMNLPLPWQKKAKLWKGKRVYSEIEVTEQNNETQLRLVSYLNSRAWLQSEATRFILTAKFNLQNKLVDLHVRHTTINWLAAFSKGPFHTAVDYAFHCKENPVWEEMFFSAG